MTTSNNELATLALLRAVADNAEALRMLTEALLGQSGEGTLAEAEALLRRSGLALAALVSGQTPDELTSKACATVS